MGMKCRRRKAHIPPFRDELLSPLALLSMSNGFNQACRSFDWRKNGFDIGEPLCASISRMLDALFSDLRRHDY